jgi:peptidoglycan/LPS O-acetylase OafA/YrhL
MTTFQSASTKAAYRPDIDGLRAIAVLLVLFNHVGIERFTGGFIGVDVFFVISGYLISGIILKDIAADRFSIARFYERRFRRIMPALLVMLLATSVLAYVFFFRLEMTSFVRTEVAALVSVSNVVLMHQSGYFAPDGRLRPLLHTWSLGVEEQFYVVFPLLLLAINRWARQYLKLILWLLTLAGFALACSWVGRDSSQAFFLAPLRAWEFLAGILLAAHALPALDQPWKRNVASASGLLLILWAGMTYQESTPFPGWHALPPCLGALLLLAAGETGTSTVGRLLSWQPIRWIGLSSYSLYLWHWPIQIFQTTNNILIPDRYPAWVARVAVIVVSIVAGALSWRFVEQPFRVGLLRARLPLFAVNGGLFALLLLFSVGMIVRDGYLPSFAPKPRAYRDFSKVFPYPDQTNWGTCYLDPPDFPAKFAKSCLADDPMRKHYLLVGDSHAAHLYWGLKTEFPELNISMATAAGCPLLYNVPTFKGGLCNAFTKFVFDYLEHHPVDTVLLGGRWSSEDADHLQQTIDWIQQHGMKVVVFGPGIEFDTSLVRLLELADRQHDPALLARHRNPGPRAEDKHMQQLNRDQWHVKYISTYDDLCNPQSIGNARNADGCPVYGMSGLPLLWDSDHYSSPGSIFFAKTLRSRQLLP